MNESFRLTNEDWESALALSRMHAACNVPPDFVFTRPITVEEGELDMITQDTFWNYADVVGRTAIGLVSRFARLSSSWDFENSRRYGYCWQYVDELGRKCDYVAITPDNLARALAKHGRYGFNGAGEQTVGLLADMLAHYVAQETQDTAT